ncbi:hypothetical protein PRK78_001616 [Emydomyces testavorans]|uniref:Uncharacterized protein n=1 Tax=Emydomyces testavorans TaxID=2070801 RepID=A0AAF0DDM2_9EURO|nr:hypothetical protein PRK78_001616 [Emydomyces testavorans]
MAVETMDAFGDQGKMAGVMASLKMHSIPPQEMPTRYESEEEEMSETDLPSPDDEAYSPVESDMGGMDSEAPRHGSHGPSSSKDFTFRMPSPTPEPEGFRSSVYNRKRGSCLALMAPKSPQPADSEKQLRKSYGPYRDSPPFQKTRFFSSMLLETDTRSLRQSICSEILSSDDDLGPETSFLIATSVVYHVPDSKPSLVSVGPVSSPSRTSPAPEHQKKRPAPLDLAPSRQPSTNTTRSGSVKDRLARLMTSKQEKRRGSHFMQFPNSSNSSILETPSFALRGWNGTEEASRFSGSESDQPPESRTLERDYWFSRRESNTSLRYSSQSQNSHHSLNQTKEEKSSPSLSQPTGFRRRITSHGQIPNSELSPSLSPLLKTAPAVSAAPRRRFVYSLTPPADRSLAPYSNSSLRTTLSQYSFAGSEPSPPRSSSSRDRTSSMKSVASTSSKLSMSPFDTTSLKSLTQRYARLPNSEDSSAQRRPSGSLLSIGHKPDARLGEKRYYSQSSGLSRASTIAVDEMKTLDDRQMEVTSRPKETYRKHKYSSSRGKKWFQDKGENISQARNKALNGLGSVIRTKIT